MLVVHGRWHEFTGGKQKVAVAIRAEAKLDGGPVLPVARILEEAECGPSVRPMSESWRRGRQPWQPKVATDGWKPRKIL